MLIQWIFRNLPTGEGGHPHRSVASLPRFAPPVEKSWLRHCIDRYNKLHYAHLGPAILHFHASFKAQR